MTAIVHRYGRTFARAARNGQPLYSILLFLALALLSGTAFGHAVTEGDKG